MNEVKFTLEQWFAIYSILTNIFILLISAMMNLAKGGVHGSRKAFFSLIQQQFHQYR